MTQGQTWMKQFQQQTQPQQSNPIQTPMPLSNKAGLNRTKTTALQQSLLGAMSSPQGMMAQQNVQR